MTDTMFRTAISTYDRDSITIRGRRVEDLMTGASFGAVAFLLLTGRMPKENEAKVFEAMLIASTDHGPNPPSTAAARVIASGNRAALEAAVAGGVLAIGDVHGGAGERLMQMMSEALSDSANPREAARRLVQDSIASKRRIPGFGHRSHEVDPRQPVLFSLAKGSGVAGRGVAFVEAVSEELKAAGRPLPINVDGAMAAILFDLGLPAHAGKAVFIIGRVVGLSAHVLEEYERERPMRFEFTFSYDGP